MVDGQSQDITLLLDDYRATLLRMDQSRVESVGDSERWNSLVNHLQELHLQLRGSRRGRRAISDLMADENGTISEWSATFALGWDPVTAKAILETIASNGNDLRSFEASITLREFDAGRLNLTWKPKTRRRST
jgi:hypothetical protein